MFLEIIVVDTHTCTQNNIGTQVNVYIKGDGIIIIYIYIYIYYNFVCRHHYIYLAFEGYVYVTTRNKHTQHLSIYGSKKWYSQNGQALHNHSQYGTCETLDFHSALGNASMLLRACFTPILAASLKYQYLKN